MANDDPGLYIIDPSDWPGAAERRAESARQQAESRRRYCEYLAPVLIGYDDEPDPIERAGIVLDALTVWRRYGSADPCRCGCHPHLPSSDFHDYGFGCSCLKSPAERARDWDDWRAKTDEYWASPEGLAITATRDRDEAALDAWLAEHPAVTVSSHGGWAPEQWTGSVDGHSFYFRERHDDWRIELDLRPTGRFVKKWVGGDLDDADSFEMVETTVGDTIADGTTRAHLYGETPVERLRFIVDTIRRHLAPQSCEVHHGSMRGALAALLGDSLQWCPSCGVRLE